MIVQISEDWRMETTRDVIELQERKEVPAVNEKTGKANKEPGEKWVAKAWHLSFAQALRSYALRKIRGLDALSELPEAEKRIMAEIASVKTQIAKEAA